MRVILLLAVLFLFVLACGKEDGVLPPDDPANNEGNVPPTAGLGGKECLDRYEIGMASFLMSPRPPTGSGELEQRVLEKDLVVRAVAMDAELKAVEIDSLEFELKGGADPYDNSYKTPYESHKYTLLIEVNLRVREYLKGEGANTITAVVEGQLVFNSPEEENCAKSSFLADFPQPLVSREGIALLDRTNESKVYHMGLTYENFDEERINLHGRHSTWLPGKDGKFYNRSTAEWISIDDVRRRVSSVLDEYNRRDDEKWKNCVFRKYYDKGRDPWAYRGVSMPFENYRDHNIMFNGEHAPVPAGTVVWVSPDPHDLYDESGRRLNVSRRMRLEGEDANLFEITYHSEYEYTFNEWRGTSGAGSHHLAIWYRPPPESTELWRGTIAGYVITAAENLEEGAYTFNLPVEYEGREVVDCGQKKFRPSKYTVIVDEDWPPKPPVPANVRIIRWLDVASKDDGWKIGWDHTHGIDDYRVDIYRLDGDEKVIDEALGESLGWDRRIRREELKGCGDSLYVEVRSKGDGVLYRSEFSEPSDPIPITTPPCEQ